MPSDAQNAKLRWEENNLPVSARFDDPYYSRDDGLAECRYVFLEGNNLAMRIASVSDGFEIAELGFGTGLNVIAALHLWRSIPTRGVLRITTFEKYPLNVSEMKRALSRWPEIMPLAEELLEHWPSRQIDLPDAVLTVLEGDVAQTLPTWSGRADAWFLDGFAPSRNPEMWSSAVLGQVGVHTKTDGSFATYTAAGAVRRGLQSAGFRVEKRSGFGSKREMLVGTKGQT